LRLRRPLQEPELLDIKRRVLPRRQLEVPLQQRTRLPQDLFGRRGGFQTRPPFVHLGSLGPERVPSLRPCSVARLLPLTAKSQRPTANSYLLSAATEWFGARSISGPPACQYVISALPMMFPSGTSQPCRESLLFCRLSPITK